MADIQLSAEAETAQVDEPILNVKNIQGNIIPGFNKDFQALLFLKIEDGKEDNFRRWLEALVPYITTMEQVLSFRSLLKEEKQAGKSPKDPPEIKITWRNIAFSHSALEKLGAIQGVDFRDKAFTQGLTPERSSKELGDPTGKDDEGNPQNWVVGGPGKEADVILIVASDDRNDLLREVECIENSLSALLKTNEERSGSIGLPTQYGTNLDGRNEHFGFRDGISQPGLRAQVSNNPGDYLTSGYKSQDNPGQDRLWPGEFVFGREYPRQDPNNKEAKGPWNSLTHTPDDVKKGDQMLSVPAAPAWAEDGSFLVFRRLHQDVGAFHQFLHDTALKLSVDDPNLSNLLGAKCVGRWASGAPILLAQQDDNPEFAKDDKNNNFKFGKFKLGEQDAEDLKGEVCPFAAHIRKVYPRDDVDESEMQTHRLLRRGIPYGERSKSLPTAPYSDTDDRGLLFLAYQTSIVNQFEFLQKRANNPIFRDQEVGHDPIIGQDQSDERKRYFRVTFKNRNGEERTERVPIEKEWVIPTGGGYFFAPSIQALRMLAHPSQKAREAYFSARSTEALRRSLKPIAGAVQPKAVTREDWARIWAHAWLPENKDFRKTLKQNPRAAVEEFQKQADRLKFPRLDRPGKLFDMGGDVYTERFQQGPFEGMSFSDMSPKDLKEIVEKGKLHGKSFCVQQNEWTPDPE